MSVAAMFGVPMRCANLSFMAPQNSRRAPAQSVTAAHLDRLTRTVDRVVQTFETHVSMLEDNRKDLVLQFKRIARLQAELDRLTQTVAKLTPSAA
jgi:hypothetical protein